MRILPRLLAAACAGQIRLCALPLSSAEIQTHSRCIGNPQAVSHPTEPHVVSPCSAIFTLKDLLDQNAVLALQQPSTTEF